MSLQDLIWLALAAYSLHMLEEYMLDWPAWARKVSRLRIEWSDFYIVNALVIVLGFVCAHFGATVPLLALVFPALMLVNAVIHIAGVIIVRGRPFPGIFTALLLFVPLGLACFGRAASDGVLSAATLWGSIGIALALHATPALLLIRDKPMFRP
jgi:hypothetical protein